MIKIVNITNTTQLSTFDMIKTRLKLESNLAKFSDKDYYEFEPNLKNISAGNLPYIVINVPFTDMDLTTLDHSFNFKDITVIISLVVDYAARDKFRGYANAIIEQIEGGEATFQSSGYYNTVIDLVDVDIEEIKEKQVVRGTFELVFNGGVAR